MNTKFESAVPSSIVLVVDYDREDKTSSVHKFIERFGDCWLKVPGIRGVYFLFDKEDKVVFATRASMIAIYPDITKADFIAAWETDHLMLDAMVSYAQTDTALKNPWMQIVQLMNSWGIEL